MRETYTDESVESFVQRPILVALNDSAKSAARLMAANNSSCAIVTLNDQAVGIITEWDILTRLVILGKDASKTPVGEIMSAPLWTVLPSTKVNEAISLMMKKGFRRLVVKDEKNVFGVISLRKVIGNRRESSIQLPVLEPANGTSCLFCGESLNTKEELLRHIEIEQPWKH